MSYSVIDGLVGDIRRRSVYRPTVLRFVPTDVSVVKMFSGSVPQSVMLLPCPYVANIVYAMYWKDGFFCIKVTATMRFHDGNEHIGFWGEIKVKVEGHDGIKCAWNKATLRGASPASSYGASSSSGVNPFVGWGRNFIWRQIDIDRRHCLVVCPLKDCDLSP